MRFATEPPDDTPEERIEKACLSLRTTMSAATPDHGRIRRMQMTTSPTMHSAAPGGQGCYYHKGAISLSSNIRMILTPSAVDLNLDHLAQLTDHVVEACITHTDNCGR